MCQALLTLLQLAATLLVRRTGLALVCLGELLRKLAICTAGRSFTHVIATRRKDQHVLVKHGVYRLCRHPAYLGWLLWAVGTQLLLANPLCAAGFAASVRGCAVLAGSTLSDSLAGVAIFPETHSFRGSYPSQSLWRSL